MTSNKILTQIIEKGGVLGAVAKCWLTDKEKINSYIKECSEICHTRLARDLWGKELVSVIIRHSKSRNFKNRKTKGFNREVINAIKVLRKRKGLKQDALADALDMTQSNYSKLEKCLIPLTVEELNAISKELKTSIAEILTLAGNT